MASIVLVDVCTRGVKNNRKRATLTHLIMPLSSLGRESWHTMHGPWAAMALRAARASSTSCEKRFDLKPNQNKTGKHEHTRGKKDRRVCSQKSIEVQGLVYCWWFVAGVCMMILTRSLFTFPGPTPPPCRFLPHLPDPTPPSLPVRHSVRGTNQSANNDVFLACARARKIVRATKRSCCLPLKYICNERPFPRTGRRNGRSTARRWRRNKLCNSNTAPVNRATLRTTDGVRMTITFLRFRSSQHQKYRTQTAVPTSLLRIRNFSKKRAKKRSQR